MKNIVKFWNYLKKKPGIKKALIWIIQGGLLISLSSYVTQGYITYRFHKQEQIVANQIQDVKTDKEKELNIPKTNRKFMTILQKRRIYCISKYYQSQPMLQSKVLTDLEVNLADVISEYSAVTQLKIKYPSIPIYNSTFSLLNDYNKVDDEFQSCSPKAMKDLIPDDWLQKIKTQNTSLASSFQHITAQNKL